MMASKSGGKVGAIFGDDDYLPLEKLFMSLDKGYTHEEGRFTLCFWVYLLKSSKPGVLIRQALRGSRVEVPFLTIEADRKLALHPLPLPLDGKEAVDEENMREVVIADQTCAMEKWVHIGCEIGVDVARLHVNGGVVGERRVEYLTKNGGGGDRGPVTLFGGDGDLNGASVQGYAHYVRLLPQPTVTNHYVKNPPLELSLDGSTGASDDHEVEEGGDGVWSVVGGKASCRRNFALDVALLDALGRSIHKEMELVALLVYADSGSPVEKPKDDAEAPLLTTFDGVEFPSTERPIKLIHGRASFKLKISQLSSKCDNRLFRVCFDSPNTPEYPFLRAFSRPIRCVSRNRNHRTPAGSWKQKSNASVFPLDGIISPVGEEMITGESLLGNGDAHSNGTPANPVSLHGPSSFLPSQPPLKRSRTSLERANGSILLDNSNDRLGPSRNGDLRSTLSGTLQRPLPQVSLAPGVFAWSADGNISQQLPLSKIPTSLDPLGSLDMGMKQEVNRDSTHLLGAAVAEVAHTHKISQGCVEGVSDFLVFKYCLENMHCRAEFMKAAIMSRSDQDLVDFAGRVSQYTGCRHNGFQILIARRLLLDGNELWKILSRDGVPVSWLDLVKHLEESFKKISGCLNRAFSKKDKEFLHRIAGCGESASRREFDRLWQWIYPIAVALVSPELQSTWESEDPKWVEGMISRDEAEALLKTEEGTRMPGTFLLRFASSRIWPHPDAGALVVSYVGNDMCIHHKLLALDVDSGPGHETRLHLRDKDRFGVGERPSRSLSEMLQFQPELTQLYRVHGNRVRRLPRQLTSGSNDVKKTYNLDLGWGITLTIPQTCNEVRTCLNQAFLYCSAPKKLINRGGKFYGVLRMSRADDHELHIDL